MKRWKFLTATLMVAGLFASPAWSSLVYSVDRNIGSGSVTGTITTDGSLGDLPSSSIIDWSLTISDSAGSFILNYPNSNFFENKALAPELVGISLTAIGDDLVVTDGDYCLLQILEIGEGGPFWGIGKATPFSSGLVETVYAGPALYDVEGSLEDYQDIFESRYSFAERSGDIVIATLVSDVSEPAAPILLMLAIGGLAWIRRLRR